MKKISIFKDFISLTVLALILCFTFATSAPADMVSNAGLIPAGYGYTHGRIPVIEATGHPELHDAAIMRYDKNSRIKDDDEVSGQNSNEKGNTYENRQQF